MKKNSRVSTHIPKSKYVVWDKGAVTLTEREKKLDYSIHAFWITGLSGSGKSTLAISLEWLLFKQDIRVYRLDGDNVRHGLNGDLGFSAADRKENIRRIGHVSRLFFESGSIVLCSFISPFRADREFVRGLFPPGRFHEIYTACMIDECIKRDPKGLYKKALAGEIADFTGINSPYEEPLHPELVLNTGKNSKEKNRELALNYIINTIQGSVKE